MTRRYDWIKDPADPRDLIYTAPRRFLGLPKLIDLRPGCSAVEDQGQVGSCTGNSSVGAREFLEIKTGAKFVDLSRLFAYYLGRVTEHTTRQDAGAMIRDVVKGMAKVGTATEALWPYDPKKVTTKPSAAAYLDAAARKITSYHRIVGLNDCRACLAEGYPFIFGFDVYDSFESDAVAQTGIMPMPKKGERMLGGHAVLAVGYDDAAQQLIVRNSWGVDWGIKGYFKMPYGYILNSKLSDDFWTIRK